ncbi:MAG: PAS domain S-box protein [Phycisphaerae bacterium]|nr:PAS domain S-box protein [Phycisphaerae bacterium]
MSAKPNTFTDAAELRRRAEALLKKQQKKKTGQPQTEADLQRLLHELQVHQIELELQNAELQHARDEVEAGLEKYTDLYDFAPVGYFSIDEQGLIHEVNLTGAALLGVERSRLVKRRLSRFVVPTSQPILPFFLERVFTRSGKQVCEVELQREDGTSFWADLQAVSAASLGGSQCRLAVSDITPLKRGEEAQRRMETLATANRELTQEINRRKAVESALKKSEQQSGRLLTKSLKLQNQLRHLSHQVLQAQEDERRRISRQLHDEILQILAGVNVHLESLKQEAGLGSRGCQEKITATQRVVGKSVDIVHQFARELRPTLLDDLGLIPALRSYIKDVMTRTGLHIQFTSFTRGKVEELDNDKRTVLYRVAQEAITNVVRHAQASLVTVNLRRTEGAVCLEIKDNGRSFQVKRILSAAKYKRLGLLCMRERVEMICGTFVIESKAGLGTLIRVEIPFVTSIKG